jgi:hypothetical protein
MSSAAADSGYFVRKTTAPASVRKVLSDVLLVPFLPRSVDVRALADVAVLVDEVRVVRDGLTALAVLNRL